MHFINSQDFEGKNIAKQLPIKYRVKLRKTNLSFSILFIWLCSQLEQYYTANSTKYLIDNMNIEVAAQEMKTFDGCAVSHFTIHKKFKQFYTR